MEELTCCDCGETWHRLIKPGNKPRRCSACTATVRRRRAEAQRKPPKLCHDCGAQLHPCATKRQKDGMLRCLDCGRKSRLKRKHCPECGRETFGKHKYCPEHRADAVRARRLQKTCPECQRAFVAKTLAQVYCTSPKDGPGNCQKIAERRRARQRDYRRPRIKMVCHHCGAEFMGEKKKRVKGTHEHYYCSHACYSEYRSWGFRKYFVTKLEWMACKTCGSKWLPNKGGHSRKCPTCFPVPLGPHSRLRNKGQPAMWRAGACRRCGTGFVGFSFNYDKPPEFCSNRCGSQTAKETRRARLANVETKAYSRHQIFERDGWVCQLCDLAVDRGAHYQNDWAPSIDHVVPISLGGPDTPENVQCAHRLCNSRKSNIVPSDEQLSLRL